MPGVIHSNTRFLRCRCRWPCFLHSGPWLVQVLFNDSNFVFNRCSLLDLYQIPDCLPAGARHQPVPPDGGKPERSCRFRLLPRPPAAAWLALPLLLSIACSPDSGVQGVRLTNDVGEVFEVMHSAVSVEALQRDFIQTTANYLHERYNIGQYYVYQWIPVDILERLNWLAKIDEVKDFIVTTEMKNYDFLMLCQKPLHELVELNISKQFKINTDNLCYEAFMQGSENVDDFFEIIRFRAVKTDLNRKKQPTPYKTVICIDSLLSAHDELDSNHQIDQILNRELNQVELTFLHSAVGLIGSNLTDLLPNQQSSIDDQLKVEVCRSFSRFPYR